MKVRKITVVISFLIVLVACDKYDEKIINTDFLIGYWVNPQVIDTVITYERANHLIDNSYGFAFISEGKFVERKNSGWCGTPPISYADYEGTWTKNDSIINITVGYWGGTTDYQWKINFINNNILTVVSLSE
jgi:hypothetical protein